MKMHRPCLWLSLALAAGIVAGDRTFLPFAGWLFLFGLALAASFIFQRAAIFYMAVFCLGAVLIQNVYLLPADDMARLSMRERADLRSVEGVVDSDVRVMTGPMSSKRVFDLQVERIKVGETWVSKKGKIQAQVYQDVPVMYGQRLRLGGGLHTPYSGKPGEKFSYRDYLRRQGIFWILSVGKKSGIEIIDNGIGNPFVALSLKTREHTKAVLNQYLAPDEAGVIAAMLVGDRGQMPRDLKDVFVRTGTAHILAISGMNMAIIAGVVFFILRLCPIPRAAQLLTTIVLLFVYTFVSGWAPSIVRACLMSSIFLAGFVFEEEEEPFNSLGLAALLLLLMDPRNLFDIGFQLSFAAVAAIFLLYGPCQSAMKFLPGCLAKPLAVSLAAWTGTAGLFLYHFGTIAPVGILANIPIVPLADMVVILALGLAFTGTCLPVFACAFAGCLKVVFNLMVVAAMGFSQIPWGYFVLPE